MNKRLLSKMDQKPFENHLTGSWKQEAMALPMVLWCIALLTGVTLLLVGIIQGWTEEEARAGRLFRARQQALSGVALAMNPGIHPGDPILSRDNSSTGEGYHVEIKDVSGLINPNTWLSPDHRALFARPLALWGLDKLTCETIADRLFDWQSPLPFKSLKGAKADEYEANGFPGLPPGRPFSSPEEMNQVLGFDAVSELKKDWQSYFTTYATNGINILYAPKHILTDLLGLTSAQADDWITRRSGKDGIEGTPDDFNGAPPPNTNSAAALWPGVFPTFLPPQCITAAPFGSCLQVESTGFCNGVKHKIIAVVGQSGGTLIGWSEE
jgi:hypothetical protein